MPGTSGFAYPAWKPDFYPADVAASRFLEHYAGRLNCVEINYTFRRTPRASTLEAWAQGTPPGFVFAVKAHQRITHVARLHDAGEPTAFFLTLSSRCARPASSVPSSSSCRPTCTCDVPRLAAFLELLPDWLRATVEFRHDSWLTDEVYELLREPRRGAVRDRVGEVRRCPRWPPPTFVYERLRKPAYSDDDLAAIAARSRGYLAAGPRRLPRVQARRDGGRGARGRSRCSRRRDGRRRRARAPTQAAMRRRRASAADGDRAGGSSFELGPAPVAA